MTDNGLHETTPGAPGVQLSFYAGLHELESACTFPRHCTKCGRVYESIADFIQQCKETPGSTGLTEYELDERVVGMYRNCICGSTLMVVCHDRRDMSPAGHRRRQLFGELLDILVAAGLEAQDARQELLLVVRGGSSPLLESAALAERLNAMAAAGTVPVASPPPPETEG